VATVNIDYHVEVERHYYSVPFRLLREKLDLRLTAHTVEAFFKGERVLAHVRSYVPYAHTTLKEHMPPRTKNIWSGLPPSKGSSPLLALLYLFFDPTRPKSYFLIRLHSRLHP